MANNADYRPNGATEPFADSRSLEQQMPNKKQELKRGILFFLAALEASTSVRAADLHGEHRHHGGDISQLYRRPTHTVPERVGMGSYGASHSLPGGTSLLLHGYVQFQVISSSIPVLCRQGASLSFVPRLGSELPARQALLP